jgi:hypothetical protein
MSFYLSSGCNKTNEKRKTEVEFLVQIKKRKKTPHRDSRPEEREEKEATNTHRK